MGVPVIVYGRSGTGKSRSLKNFGEDEIFFVNCVNKPLPFRKKFTYTLASQDVAAICSKLRKMPTGTAVIDDAGYLMTARFMMGHGGKEGNQFAIYNEIGDIMWDLMKTIQALPPDRIVFLVFHEETSDYGASKIRTIGRLLDQKVCLEGMATIVLRSDTDGERWYFQTRCGKDSIAKAPEGMFDEVEIPNDLKAVETAIREYYDITEITPPQETKGAAVSKSTTV